MMTDLTDCNAVYTDEERLCDISLYFDEIIIAMKGDTGEEKVYFLSELPMDTIVEYGYLAGEKIYIG